MKRSYCSVFALACSFLLPSPLSADEVGVITLFKSDASHMLELKLNAAVRDVVIGGYNVKNDNSLQVCDKSGTRCADPYAGAVLQLNPRDKLIIDLSNNLQSNGAATPDHCMVMPMHDDSLLNLHTHGLLVSPYVKQRPNGGPVFGDNIFSCTSSQTKNGSVVGNAMRYEITLNDTGLNKPHPLGIDWIHPHVHGIAKAQVSSGMASMIVIGDINKQLCALPSPDGAPRPRIARTKFQPTP
jgi:hypothetical protein